MKIAINPDDGGAWAIGPRLVRISACGTVAAVSRERVAADITADGEGNVWAAILESDRVVKLSPAGKRRSWVSFDDGGGRVCVNSIASAPDDGVWVAVSRGASEDESAVARLSSGGDLVDKFPVSLDLICLAADREGNAWAYNDSAVAGFTAEGKTVEKRLVGEGDRPRLVAPIDGGVWISNRGAKTLQRLDRNLEAEKKIGLPRKIRDLATGPGGEIWMSSELRPTVCKLSDQGEPLGEFELGFLAGGLAVGPDGGVWVIDRGQTSAARLDPDGNILGAFPLMAQGFTVADGKAWMADADGDVAGRVTRRGIPAGSAAIGNGPHALAVDREGNVWASSTGRDKGAVRKLSPQGRELGKFKVGAEPCAIAFDKEGAVWVANRADNDVTKLSAEGKRLGRFPAGRWPCAIACDGDGVVWVANAGSHEVRRLSAKGELLTTTPVGVSPHGIAIDSEGWVWVANFGTNDLSLMAKNGAELERFPAGPTPLDVVIDSEGCPWTSNWSAGTLTQLYPTGEPRWKVSVTEGGGGRPTRLKVVGDEVWAAHPGGHLTRVGPVTATPHVFGPAFECEDPDRFGGLAVRLSGEGEVLDTFSVGAYPMGVAIDNDGALWIPHRYLLGKFDNKGRRLAINALPAKIANLAVANDNGLWVQYEGGVDGARVDKKGKVLFSFKFGEKPEAIRRLYPDDDGALWSPLLHEGAVVKVPADGSEVKRIEMDCEVSEIFLGQDDDLWVVSGASGEVTRLSLAGEVLSEFTVESRYRARLWSCRDGTLGMLNPKTATLSNLSVEGKVLSTTKLDMKLQNDALMAVDYLGDAYIADRKKLEKRSPDGVRLAGFPMGTNSSPMVADDGGGVWFLGHDKGIARFSPDGKLMAKVNLGGGSSGLTSFDADGALWITVSTEMKTVRKLAPAPARRSFPVGDAPEGIAVDGDGNAWVACRKDKKVIRLSPEGAVQGSFEGFDRGPMKVDFSPKGDAWVTVWDEVVRLGADGGRLHDFKAPVQVRLHGFDKDSNAWVSYEDKVGGGMGAVVALLSSEAEPIEKWALPFRPQTLVPAPDGGVWVVQGALAQAQGMDKAVVRYGRSGERGKEVPLLAGNAPEVGVIDAAGDLWVAGGPDVYRLSARGKVLAMGYFGLGVREFVLAPDGAVWVYSGIPWPAAVRLSEKAKPAESCWLGADVGGAAFDPAGALWITDRATNTAVKMDPRETKRPGARIA